LIRHQRPLTVAEREQQIAKLEAEFQSVAAEYGPGDAFEKVAARLDAKSEEIVVAKKLRIYQMLLDRVGYISDPSPAEEAFLDAHKRELRNLVVIRTPIDSASSIDVHLIGWPLKEYMTVESCQSNGLLLRCLAKVKSGYPLEGWRMAAKASKWDGSEFVALAGTTVIAPTLMGAGTSELKILLPDRADIVFLSYR
jgi:hypothetical protein